jgi:hypothetical protein
MSEKSLKKLIVVHGWGGTFTEVFDIIDRLFDFDCTWRDGAFLVDRRTGRMLRDILGARDCGRYFRAFQKLIISRLLRCCCSKAPRGEPDKAGHTRFSDRQLMGEFSHLGIPVAPGPRADRSRQLEREAAREMEPLKRIVTELKSEAVGKDGARLTETGIRELISARSASLEESADLLALLEKVRGMQETGGDLDTVTSAAFYTHWLVSDAQRNGRDLVYGRDYEYVFVNYHDSLRWLEKFAPAELYMADLPVGAFPEIEGDVSYLSERGVIVARFEDHHPVNTEQKEMMERMEKQGTIRVLRLSGPMQGEELSRKDMKCGADMVYENTIQGRTFDCEGARELRKAAHAEDFAADRYEFSRLLTDLIKAGISKVEIIQAMIAGIPENTTAALVRDKGWDSVVAKRRQYLAETEQRFLDNSFVVNFARSGVEKALVGGSPMAAGSDMPQASLEGKARGHVSIVVSLAPKAEPGKPRIDVGNAADFFAREMPDADYLFYCYGSSILVARRLNEADLTFNLGKLMPMLGSAGDGGHSGAAVCRPERNEVYPEKLLGRVNESNFRSFVGYLAGRIGEAGHELKGIEDRSRASSREYRPGTRKILAVLAAAFVIGIALAAFHPAFQTERIRQSNRDFFPQLETESGPAPGGSVKSSMKSMKTRFAGI